MSINFAVGTLRSCAETREPTHVSVILHTHMVMVRLVRGPWGLFLYFSFAGTNQNGGNTGRCVGCVVTGVHVRAQRVHMEIPIDMT